MGSHIQVNKTSLVIHFIVKLWYRLATTFHCTKSFTRGMIEFSPHVHKLYTIQLLIIFLSLYHAGGTRLHGNYLIYFFTCNGDEATIADCRSNAFAYGYYYHRSSYCYPTLITCPTCKSYNYKGTVSYTLKWH